jgi:hypothetical protein
MLSLALSLALALPAPPEAPAPVRAALSRALALPDARVEIDGFSASLPPGCRASEAEALRPLVASGRAALRLRGGSRGSPCEGFGWARVRVFARALVASRSLRQGEAVSPAAAPAETEVLPGRAPLSALPPGAVAARAIAAGAPIEAALLRVGPAPGDAVAVRLRVGDVEAEQAGRALPCARGRACALLPSGRRVEGAWDGARILVEIP